eukprot:6318007-Amphidinium_carterae.1
MHVIVHLEVGRRTLHIFNVYGYDESYPDSCEWNRSILDELLPHVHSLRDHPYVIGGDWNFEPDEFPIPLARGDTVVRPPSANLPTSPYTKGETGRQINWFLISPHMRDSAGAEYRLESQPDHYAVGLTLTGSWIPQTFLKKVKAPPAVTDHPAELWAAAWAERSKKWCAALQAGDVDAAWNCWNDSATASLGLQVGDRGVLKVQQAKSPMESQRTQLEEVRLRASKDRQKASKAGWEKFVKEAAENSPSKLFKWVRGTTKVWDLAVRTPEGWASSPGEVATSELRAWSKLWKPGHTVREPGGHEPRLPGRGGLWEVLARIKKGKALGADHWTISELRSLGLEAIGKLEVLFLFFEQQGRWPDQLRELLYLQLPKDGAKEAGQRRPIALLPMIYRIWAAWQKHRVTEWRGLCTSRGETPVGTGALDEAFALAAEAERATTCGEPFAAVFLDCSKCYERVDLALLEQSAVEAGFPLEALQLALDMYRGRRRIL